MTVFTPTDAADIAALVAEAAAEARPLEIVSGGSKNALGRAQRSADVLDLSRVAGVVGYEPSELTLTVRPATPMAEIAALLDGHSQMLSFEPPDWSGLLGSDRNATLGGTIACGMAGPRRVRAGSARDLLLGFAAVNGRGEPWKAGGKVVKNVTGYDLCKLQTGAFGTLSVLTELTLKVMPRPETAATLLLKGLYDGEAMAAMAGALNTEHEVSAAAHLPGPAVERSGVLRDAGIAGAVTALRLEGPPVSVAYRLAALAALQGPAERLDAAQTARLWTEIGAVRPLLGPAACVWRICPTPSGAPTLAAELRGDFASAEILYDWGGGLVWLGLAAGDAGPDGGAALVRGAVRRTGGHATLIAAPEILRASVPVFEPLDAAHRELCRRVKTGFDPLGVLNPRRMYEGF
jgi:glycolate oxidase FAD binding subunit